MFIGVVVHHCLTGEGEICESVVKRGVRILGGINLVVDGILGGIYLSSVDKSMLV